MNEPQCLNAQVQSLVEFSQSNSNLHDFLSEASKTKLTQVSLSPLEPKDLRAQDDQGLPTSEWSEWLSKNNRTFILTDQSQLSKELVEVPEGSLSLFDPEDSPYQYGRSFIALHFANGKITKIESRSL